jgi:hypothetical protein
MQWGTLFCKHAFAQSRLYYFLTVDIIAEQHMSLALGVLPHCLIAFLD